jgi:hypothetical protein
MSQGWAEKELARINLGNERLNKRCMKLLDRLGDTLPPSIPHACNGWAKTQAAYRFLAQEGIRWKDILRSHLPARSSACRDDRWCYAFKIRPTGL